MGGTMTESLWSLEDRQVYALLRSLLAWAPAAKTQRSHATPGFIQSARDCLNCRANGTERLVVGRRVLRVVPNCVACKGTGRVLVADRMQTKTRADRMAGGHDDKQAREDAWHARDRAIERLGRQLSDAPEDAPDRLLDAIEGSREWQYRHGHYRELEIALEELRSYSPAWHDVAMGVVYQPFVEAPVDPPVTWTKVRLVCEWLAGRVGQIVGPDVPIRVPQGVAVFTADELARQSTVAKDALARGSSVWASAGRAERKRLILELHAQGVPDGKIAARFGLTRRRVSQIRSGIEGLLDGNGHEEAA